MTLYHFVDGPLAGQTLTSSDPHTQGEVLAIGVVDILDDPDDCPSFEYLVVRLPGQEGPGLLRHAAA
ncbi:MAG TPA: hypothetical protein VN257_04690 [Actinotalea sp.]|nr:hypothetical protein [Actinotalea sp.]